MECSLPKGTIKIQLYVSCVSGEFYCGVNVLAPDSHTDAVLAWIN